MSDEKILTQEQCKAIFRRVKLYILFLRRNRWKYKLDKYEFLLRKAYRIISVLEQQNIPGTDENIKRFIEINNDIGYFASLLYEDWLERISWLINPNDYSN